MTLQEVKDLAIKGEGLQIEFKKKAAYPEKIVREVIALANTQGGTLLIGWTMMELSVDSASLRRRFL